MTIDFLALRSSSIVVMPLAPGKSFVAASASRTFVAVGAAGAVDRVGHHLHRVVAEDRHRVGRLAAVLRLVGRLTNSFTSGRSSSAE